jgi:hypothetical protein
VISAPGENYDFRAVTAYGPSAEIMGGCAAFGSNHFESFGEEAPEPADYLAASDTAIVACFRGTAEIQDVLSDIRIHLTGGPLAGKVHDASCTI